MWNERYDKPGFVFGTEPSQFLRKHKGWLKQGDRALAVADGEGRNSVYLAEQGLTVTAMDSSIIGLKKAKRLSGMRGVDVDFLRADLESWDWQAARFDIVVAIFIQFAEPSFRAKIFDGIECTLKPGGVLMLHGYTPSQVGYGTGGPPNPDHLYTRAMLESRFGAWDIAELREYEMDLQEGTGHSGRSALIDLIARKP